MKTNKKFLIALFLLFLILLSACAGTPSGQAPVPRKVRETPSFALEPDETAKSDTAYIFQAEDNFDNLSGSSKIYDLIDGFGDDYGIQCALVYGKIRTLFGEPVYETEDDENLYSYCICATPPNGGSIYLEVYSGPTGPSIGGGQGDEAQQAAQALSEYIWQAPPSDYACKSYYADTASVIEMGVEDGIPYCRESIDPDAALRQFFNY